MSDEIINDVVMKHAPKMLKYATLVVGIAKLLRVKEAVLDENAQMIAGRVYTINHVVRAMAIEDLEEIEKMGRQICFDAEATLYGAPKSKAFSKIVKVWKPVPKPKKAAFEQEPKKAAFEEKPKKAAFTVYCNVSQHEKVKATAYSKKKIEAQALKLRVVRHKHAHKVVGLIKKLGVFVNSMKKLESRIKEEMKEALQVAGHESESVEDSGFERADLTFASVLKKVDAFWGKTLAVANASVPPPPPSA